MATKKQGITGARADAMAAGAESSTLAEYRPFDDPEWGIGDPARDVERFSRLARRVERESRSESLFG